MILHCPKCLVKKENIIRYGFYFRTSDSKKIRRYRCKSCLSHFSSACFSPNYRQNKRRVNPIVKYSLCSSMSQRRIAKVLNISRLTVKRKLIFLAQQARLSHETWLKTQNFSYMQFDDLETFEHSKYKPVTVTLCVSLERKIIGFGVAQIPAKGYLTKVSVKKYGFRKNESFLMRDQLFESLKRVIRTDAEISSDEHPNYKAVIAKYFPQASYQRFKGGRSCLTGQGELKKVKFDPLFKINHTFAMLRANINRLVRHTWCTTKSLKSLEDHIALYVSFHNELLT